MPCLVQTEALFDEDRWISFPECAAVWKIQRLCLPTQRPCLVKQTWCIVYDVSNRYLFPQIPFPFLNRMAKPVLSIFVGPMRPLFGQYEYLFENMFMFDTS